MATHVLYMEHIQNAEAKLNELKRAYKELKDNCHKLDDDAERAQHVSTFIRESLAIRTSMSDELDHFEDELLKKRTEYQNRATNW